MSRSKTIIPILLGFVALSLIIASNISFGFSSLPRIDGAKVLIIVGDGFGWTEYSDVKNNLTGQGATVLVASYEKKEIYGYDGGSITPNLTFTEVNVSEYDAFYIPGGYSPENLLTDPRNETLLNLIREANDKYLILSAICHGPWVLANASVVEGKKGTGYSEVGQYWVAAGGIWTYPNLVERDGNLLTAQYTDEVPKEFKEALVSAIAEWLAGFDLNLRVRDWDLVDSIQGAHVYKDSAEKVTDSNGWANWTGVSKAVEIKVKWFGVWVNGTFTVKMNSDKTIDIKCNIFDIIVTCVEGQHQAFLQYVNVTVFAGGDKIQSGITGADGKAYLANVPNSTLTFVVYDANNEPIANVTRTITSEEQKETITCDENFVTSQMEWKIAEVRVVSSSLFWLFLTAAFIYQMKCLKQRNKTLRCKHREKEEIRKNEFERAQADEKSACG